MLKLESLSMSMISSVEMQLRGEMLQSKTMVVVAAYKYEGAKFEMAVCDFQ